MHRVYYCQIRRLDEGHKKGGGDLVSDSYKKKCKVISTRRGKRKVRRSTVRSLQRKKEKSSQSNSRKRRKSKATEFSSFEDHEVIPVIEAALEQLVLPEKRELQAW